MSGLVTGFGRRPRAGRLCGFWGRRSKASQGGNRGEEGRCLVLIERSLGGRIVGVIARDATEIEAREKPVKLIFNSVKS